MVTHSARLCKVVIPDEPPDYDSLLFAQRLDAPMVTLRGQALTISAHQSRSNAGSPELSG